MKSTTSHRHARKAALFASLALAIPLGTAAPAAATPDLASTSSVDQVAPQVSPELAEQVLERRAGKSQASRSAHRPSAKKGASVGARALAAARTKAGSSYGYGGVGPSVFDCSGLTAWAYARVGEQLPHSSDAQVGRVVRVSRPQLGDLVFFHNGGNVYHVGLWAGPGKVFHASKPGTPVGVGPIWTSSIFFGRVR